MSGRSLAYLAGVGIEHVKGVGQRLGPKLREASIESVADLFLHFPRRHIDRSLMAPMAEVPLGTEVTVLGTVEKVNSRRPARGLVIVEVLVADETGAALWATFFNQAFRERQLRPGTEVALSGKAERYRGRLQMKSPVVDVLSRAGHRRTGRIVPVYPSAGGVVSWRLEEMMANALRRSRPITDPLPPGLVDSLGLVGRDEAFASFHFPEDDDARAAARQRLVFDELFRLEVALALQKHRQIDEAVGIAHAVDAPLVDAYVESLPFALTTAQERTIAEIQSDMAAPHPMHRLLQGDVGSGKTAVAMAALLTAVQGGHQGAVMAPTEVLAEQHYLGLEPLARPHGVRMALLTASAPDRAAALEGIAAGTVDIVVGTHALIQEGVSFHRLGMAVVDEQHRFGVHQRVRLREMGEEARPDLLIMTATPIPRTLSMTLYGDLDVSLLDEMPAERPAVETVWVEPGSSALDAVYERVREQAAATCDHTGKGRQTFVVCPLVEESEKLQAASATAEFERLESVFPDLRLGLLHGQMRSEEKREVMAALRDGAVDVLVATTVIEVGIDVPCSTIMIVEDADRFGLSQLHQLRGRLSRGAGPNWCYLIADPTTDDGKARLEAMVSTDDGFRLAEEDLRIRGQGTVFGERQAGLGDLRLADILVDTDSLVTARREAFALVAADPGLDAHPDLRDEVAWMLGDRVDWLFKS